MAKTIALPQLPKRRRSAGLRGVAARVLRCAVFIAIVLLLMFQADRQARWRADDPVRLDEARTLFSDAARVTPSDTLGGGFDVTDTQGQLLGRLVRTMPAAQDIVGYRGPTDALLALDTDDEIVGMRLRRSADTPDHLRDVANDREFMANFNGWRLHDLADYDNARALEDADIWPVSGATLTSSAVIDGVVARAKAQEKLDAPKPAVRLGLQDAAIGLWVLGGLVLMFTKLRRSKRCRTIYRVLTVAWHLGLGGGLIAISLLTGWAMHGPAWRTAPALTAMVALMFAIPLLLGRNVYCQELCPHGIVQGWLRRTPLRNPAACTKPWRNGFRWFAPSLLALALLIVLLDLPQDLAGFEPFDTYPLWRSGGWAMGATVFVFIVGLALSVRYPMAYCQHLCPTGWLLRTAAGQRGGKRFAVADITLLVVLLVTAGVVCAGHRAWLFAHPMENAPTLMTPLQEGRDTPPPRDAVSVPMTPALLVLDGTTMRTTWRVVVLCDHDDPLDADLLGQRITRQLAKLESVSSVWRRGSDPDLINRAPPGRWVAVRPEAWPMFVAAQDIEQRSGGAFNPALGQAVIAAGLGPKPPASLQRAQLRPDLGQPAWELDADNRRARRLSSEVALDFGGILQGYAADQVAHALSRAGVAGCMVEVGGEVRTLGIAPAGGWRVRHRDADNAGTSVLAPGQGLANSDTRTTTRAGQSHLIDPATGRSQSADCRVTVRANDAATADAWATALAAAGPRLAAQLIAHHQLTARYAWTDHRGNHVIDRLGRVED